ncbi:MAG: MucR family transcriptional regulator [Microvirga sp.]
MDQPEQQLDFASITADIVSSYVANNSVHRADLPNVIASVHAALRGLVAPKPAEPEKPQPPVSIRKSVTPDFLISLEDGKKYKSLKRHLRRLGFTPDQYRAKWELPVDYPMIAPNYAAKRSELAKSIGLGHLRRKAAPEAAVITDEKVAAPVEGAKPKRGRPAKSKTIE